MKKTNAKKYLSLLLVVFIYSLLAVPIMTSAAGNTVPAPNDACDGKNFCLNVPIGTAKGFDVGNNSLGEYIQVWYGFMLGAIGILATVMIMWGGFKYLTSRGDKGMIDSGKTIIISAITGVVLAFGTYTILSIVNPALTTITMPSLPTIQGGENVNLTNGGAVAPGTNKPIPFTPTDYTSSGGNNPTQSSLYNYVYDLVDATENNEFGYDYTLDDGSEIMGNFQLFDDLEGGFYMRFPSDDGNASQAAKFFGEQLTELNDIRERQGLKPEYFNITPDTDKNNIYHLTFTAPK